MLTLFFSVFNYLCSKAQCAQNMDIVNWMIKSNTHREHWWRKLLFHLWILLFLLQMAEVIRKSDFVGIRLSSIRSDTVCLVIFMLSHSAGARRRTGFGGLGCLCCWQEQVKEQTEILLWAPCVMCSSTGQNYGFFFVCWFSKCLEGHSQLPPSVSCSVRSLVPAHSVSVDVGSVSPLFKRSYTHVGHASGVGDSDNIYLHYLFNEMEIQKNYINKSTFWWYSVLRIID